MADSSTQRNALYRASAWVYQELGLSTVRSAPRDAHIILVSRFTRVFAYGSTTLVLALYFVALGFADEQIGLFMSLTLLGDVLISLVLALWADRLGRRRMLMLGGLMMAGSGVVFAIAGNYWILLAAAVFGVISPGGNEIGPFRAIEESTLAQLITAEIRTDIFAWYNIFGSAATAVGSLACGWFVQYLLAQSGWNKIRAFRAVFWVYACLGLVKFLLALCLSDKCEVLKKKDPNESRATPETEPLLQDSRPEAEISRLEGLQPGKKKKKSAFAELTKHTWAILFKLLPLFAVDSFASGLVPFSLISYFIVDKFDPAPGLLGTVMSVTLAFAATSNIFASAIAKRIGPIKTMVFTHLPSAIFLLLLPLPSSSQLGLTVFFLIARYTLATMDQAPRSAFLSATVLPEERTAVMGVVNVAKSLSQSGGPLVTGVLAGGGRFWVAFVVAGSLKVTYDIMLLVLFINVKADRDRQRDEPAEEVDQLNHATTTDSHPPHRG